MIPKMRVIVPVYTHIKTNARQYCTLFKLYWFIFTNITWIYREHDLGCALITMSDPMAMNHKRHVWWQKHLPACISDGCIHVYSEHTGSINFQVTLSTSSEWCDGIKLRSVAYFIWLLQFRVTGHLCGEFTGHRWIPRTMASDAELWCFLWSASELTAE